MRTIGVAEAALSAMVHRAHHRSAFGGVLADKDTVCQSIAQGRIEITKCRSLCYLAAYMADTVGFKAARKYISMIKVAKLVGFLVSASPKGESG
jgi:acyl-CoA dehydrogenase